MGISSQVGIDHARASARRRRGAALRVLEGALVAAGTTLLIVYAAAQIDARRGSQRALEAFAAARSSAATDIPQPESPTASLDYPDQPDQSLWGTTRVAAYRASLTAQLDTPLGVLTIASVSLEAPIFEGTSELTLNRGVGRIEGTADVSSAGNLGLAAHRDGFFRALKDVRVGDTVTVESLRGTARYRVTELLVVEPTDIYVLAPTDTATLTLVTCYPFYFVGEAPQRYIVKGVAEQPAS